MCETNTTGYSSLPNFIQKKFVNIYLVDRNKSEIGKKIFFSFKGENRRETKHLSNENFLVMLNNPTVNRPLTKKENVENPTAVNHLKSHRNHNYENMLEMGKQIKLKKLKELQKKSKQAELKSKTVKAIAQHNSFRYFSRHGDNETHPYIDLLDDFLLVEIFSYMSTIDKLKLQFVCKRWHRIIWSNENSYKLFKSIEIYEV